MVDKKKPKRLYLLDAMALAYRSHFIFIGRPLVNSKGQNTSATYGFTSALLKLIEDHGIEHIAVVFDALDEGGTFRDDLYESYKANREPPPDELIDNIPRIKAVVDAFDIPVFEIGGVEADDVIGTLARKAEDDGADVVIVSPDKDFQQLISDHVSLFRPAYRGEEFEPVTLDSFRERWRVDPVQFIDIQALWGDSTDNVPGVPGIGEKTAAKLIQEYGSIEHLLEHADDVSGKRAREGLKGHGDQARLSKELVTIRTDVDIDLDWDKVHQGRPDGPRIRDVFRELEFNTLWNRTQRILRLDRAESGQASLFTSEIEENATDVGSELSAVDHDEQDFGVLTSVEELRAFAADLEAVSDTVGLSVVLTDDESPMIATIAGIALAAAGMVRYVPIPMPDGTTAEAVVSTLLPVIQAADRVVGHNLKPGLVALGRIGVDVSIDMFDTMVAHYLCAPEQPHSLEAISGGVLGLRPESLDSLLGRGKARRSPVDVPASQLGPLVCENVHVIMELVLPLRGRLDDDGLADIADRVEFPLIPVLARVERNGIRIDTEVLSEISSEMRGQIDELERNIYGSAGTEFNIGSPAQLAEILFDKLGLPVISKTSTGKPSTREMVLQELATQHELPAMILDWRELTKLCNTYVDNLPTLVNPETGRLHTVYNQTVTATGRLSSQNPNLQNIPVRSARGREIRRAFVPEKGWKLVAADYVQIELRILASMSGDPGLREAFESNLDVHTATAARMFGVDLKDVNRTQRNRAKEVNYGIPYGISAFGLAQRLRCPRAEAQELIDEYQRSYRKVAGFLANQVERAREVGYVETLLGRRRYIPDINARNRMQRAAAERIASNMPMQGTQADMIKLAMIAIQRTLDSDGFRARMLLQVHDELVFEAPDDEVDRLVEVVRREMITALPLEVPVEVEISVAGNWLDAH